MSKFSAISRREQGRPTRLVEFYTVLAYWNNSLQVDMSLHSDTLSKIRTMKSWLLLLNTVCLAEKQQIPILLSLVWPEHAYHYTTDAVNFCLRHTSNWNHMFVVSINELWLFCPNSNSFRQQILLSLLEVS
jgi:hypothetical protein